MRRNILSGVVPLVNHSGLMGVYRCQVRSCAKLSVLVASGALLSLAGCTSSSSGPMDPTKDVNVAGSWQGSATDEGGPSALGLDLNQAVGSSSVSGTFECVEQASGAGFTCTGSVQGTVRGSQFTGRMRGSYPLIGCAVDIEFDAVVSGSNMKGTFEGQGCSGQIRDGSFNLTKATSPTQPEHTQHRLTVQVTGSGSISSDPAGISCPSDCSHDYDEATLATLTASPADGWQFDGWSGDCSGTGSCVVALDTDRSVAATFVMIVVPLRTLTAQATGSGMVVSDPVGISCPSDCSQEFAEGTEVTLAASPTTGWEFSGWSGACVGRDICQLTMTENKSVTATFVQKESGLSVSVIGGGTVTSSPAGISCPSDCDESYASGTVVALTALPATDWEFAGWGGACSGTGSCQISMSTNRSVTATFHQMFTLVFGVHVDGGGSVSVDTGGVRVGECSSPGVPCNLNLPAQTEAFLTATPEPGWQLQSWSGTSNCSGQDPACTVLMTDDQVAIARFQDPSATCGNYGNAGRTPDYQTYRAPMEQVTATGPLYVTSSSSVDICALVDAGHMLDVMLRQRADLRAELRDAGALTAVFGRGEGPCDLPYFSDLLGQPACDASGGLGGVPGRPATACSELNLLKDPEDPFGRGTREDGENVCVHELAHTIMNVGLTSMDRDRIQQRFEAEEVHQLWAGDFALTNADEFFAEMSQAYFCANPEVPAFNHNHGINCGNELEAYDPLTFALIDQIFNGAAADLR